VSSELGFGSAGTITVDAGSISPTRFGEISPDTSGRGNGGCIIVDAGSMSLSDGGWGAIS
jgi:hypothetical protein